MLFSITQSGPHLLGTEATQIQTEEKAVVCGIVQMKLPWRISATAMLPTPLHPTLVQAYRPTSVAQIGQSERVWDSSFATNSPGNTISRGKELRGRFADRKASQTLCSTLEETDQQKATVAPERKPLY